MTSAPLIGAFVWRVIESSCPGARTTSAPLLSPRMLPLPVTVKLVANRSSTQSSLSMRPSDWLTSKRGVPVEQIVKRAGASLPDILSLPVALMMTDVTSRSSSTVTVHPFAMTTASPHPGTPAWFHVRGELHLPVATDVNSVAAAGQVATARTPSMQAQMPVRDFIFCELSICPPLSFSRAVTAPARRRAFLTHCARHTRAHRYPGRWLAPLRTTPRSHAAYDLSSRTSPTQPVPTEPAPGETAPREPMPPRPCELAPAAFARSAPAASLPSTGPASSAAPFRGRRPQGERPAHVEDSPRRAKGRQRRNRPPPSGRSSTWVVGVPNRDVSRLGVPIRVRRSAFIVVPSPVPGPSSRPWPRSLRPLPISTHYSPLTTHYSLLTTHY